MPFYTPVLADVAARVRPSSSSNSSVAMAVVVDTAHRQRLPSSRPIDHRWDQSRGIVFTAANRSTAPRRTWSPGNGIAFDPPNTSKRCYASQRLGRTSASAGKTTSDDASDSWIGSSHKGFGMQALKNGHAVESVDWKDKHAKEKKVRKAAENDLDEARESRKAAEQDRDRAREERDTAELRASEAERLKEEARSRQESDLQDAVQRAMAAHDQALHDEKSQHREMVQKLMEESAPERRKNEIELADARQQGADATRESYEAKIVDLNAKHRLSIHDIDTIHQQELKDMAAKHEQRNRQEIELTRLASKRVEELQKELKETRSERDAYRTESRQYRGERDGFQDELRDTESRTVELQEQLDGRQGRNEVDRSDYESYREVFRDVEPDVFALIHNSIDVQEALSRESHLWERSASMFQAFRSRPDLQQTLHHNLANAIQSFLQQRASNARATYKGVERLTNIVEAKFVPFSRDAHLSRKLTMHHHFEEHETHSISMDLAWLISIIEPFRNRRDAYEGHLDALTSELQEARQATDEPRAAEILERQANLRDTISFWSRVISLMENTRKLQSLKALLHDTAVEKAVFLNSFDIIADLPKKGKTPGPEIHAQMHEFQMSLRSYYNTGHLTPSEQSSNDAAIRRRIDRAQRVVEYCLSGMKPDIYGFAARGVIKRPTEHLRQPLLAARGSRARVAKRRAALLQIAANKDTGKTRRGEKIPSRNHSRSRDPVSFGDAAQEKSNASADTKRRSTIVRRVGRRIQALQETSASSASTSDSSSGAGTKVPIPKFLSPMFAPLQAPGSSTTSNVRSFHSGPAISTTAEPSQEFIAGSQPTAGSDQADDSQSTPVSASNMHESEGEGTKADEPSVELTYHIPPKDYRAAAMASPATSAAFWSYRMYKGSSGDHPAVYYCTSFEAAEKQAKLFLDQPVLGFDMEWEPRASLRTGNIKQNVSLIQLAAEDKIGLFQLACFEGETIDQLLPPSLRIIFESPGVVKTGVNIRGDATRLERCLGVKMQGMFELSHLFRVVKYSADEPHKVNFKPVSLADQVEGVLRLPLKKDENRVSAWSRRLNGQQTNYAASDAYAGFRLYHELERQRKQMTPTPPRPGFHESNQPLVLGDGSKVYRSENRVILPRNGNKQTTTAVTGEDEDEGSEEFFDTVEELDPDGLAKPKPSNFDFSAGPTQVSYPSLPQNMDEMASTNAEDGPSVSSSPDVTKGERRGTRPVGLELSSANLWLESRESNRASLSNATARPNELRSYYLWHTQNLEPQEVAALLRDPPLSIATVASYILQAVKVESQLPYDVERMSVVLDILPSTVHWRYSKIVARVKKGSDGK